MKYELEVITDIIYQNAGRVKLVKRGDKIKMLFDLDKVDIEEYVDNKTGKHNPKYTTLIDNNQPYKVNKPYEELKELILNRSIPVLGFAAKSKRWK